MALGNKTANNNFAYVEAEHVPPTNETPAIIMYTSAPLVFHIRNHDVHEQIVIGYSGANTHTDKF